MFEGAAACLGSCKQTVSARSTIEFELITLDTTHSEAEWLKNLIFELPISFMFISPIFIHSDSRAITDELLKQNTLNRKLNRHLNI